MCQSIIAFLYSFSRHACMFLFTVTTIYFYFYLFLHFFKNIIFKENDNEKLCGNKFNINHQIIRIYESCTKTREKQLISRTEC